MTMGAAFYTSTTGYPTMPGVVAVSESVGLYQKIERGVPEKSLDQALAMAGGVAFWNLTKQLPLEAENLGTGATEKVAPQDRAEFLKLYDARDGAGNLATVYPRAHDYYKSLRGALAAGAGQDPDRKEWQETAWRPYHAAKAGLDDTARIQRVRHMFNDPALARIERVAPWSVLDVQQALVESLPNNVQPIFAQQFILEGSAFKTLAEECPVVVPYYRGLIAGKFGLDRIPTVEPKESNPGIGM